MLTVSNRLEEITVREGASNMAADTETTALLLLNLRVFIF